jgi:4-amino-4-deoxychorismate lyase
MSLLIESIKLLDGKFYNLFYHEQRMIRSLHSVCGIDEEINLEKFLSGLDVPSKGLYKCRIVYDELTKDVEFFSYQPKSVRNLKIVENDRISYEFKYRNRKSIDRLFELRQDCDDILIIKKGNVTDSSFSNVAFRKGKRWFTPWTPLLKGTMLQNLLEHEKIEQEQIALEDIKSFETCKLINAMFEFEGPEIDVSDIVL